MPDELVTKYDDRGKPRRRPGLRPERWRRSDWLKLRRRARSVAAEIRYPSSKSEACRRCATPSGLRPRVLAPLHVAPSISVSVGPAGCYETRRSTSGSLSTRPSTITRSTTRPSSRAMSTSWRRRLIGTYGLRGKEIVEIGCGSGDFLTALCLLGGNRGVGYDPSHDPARAPVHDNRVQITADAYPSDGVTADLVVARHVLEHVPDPGAMVSSVRASMADGVAGIVYCEVPDATYMVETGAMWDLIHEHCSYFSSPTLSWLFERSGFQIVDTGRSLGDQYLWIEARPAPLSNDEPAFPDSSSFERMLDDFADAFRSTVEGWRHRLGTLDPQRVAVWGAGAKGVMFLNLVDPEGRIGKVVDINPHKRGRHVPGTGQRIVDPPSLAAEPPEHVIVMNPLFCEEIDATLRRHGVTAEIHPA